MHTLFLILLSATTLYTDHTFHTIVETEFDTSVDRAIEVANLFVYDLQTDIDHLGTWAYKNTGENNDEVAEEKKEGRNAIRLEYTGNEYDHENRKGVTLIDVIVPQLNSRRSIRMETAYRDSLVAEVYRSRLDIENTSHLIDKADAQFVVTPMRKNKCYVSLTLDVKLGWFFRIFVSPTVWRNMLEWRLETILFNLKEYAETGQVTDRKSK